MPYRFSALLLLFVFSTTLYCQKQALPGKFEKKNLMGKHWSGSCNNSDCDTMTYFAHRKYSSDLYQWGGNLEGMEFYKNDSAQTFSNVLCSSESSPVDSYTSSWKLSGDTLLIDGRTIKVTYRIINLHRKRLRLLQLHWESKVP